MRKLLPFSRKIALLSILGMAVGVAPVAGVPLRAPRSRPRPGFGVVRYVTPPVKARIEDGRRPGFGRAPEAEWWPEHDVRVDGTVRRQPFLEEAAADEWIARLRPGVNPHLAARRLGCRVKRATGLPHTYLLERDPELAEAPVAAVAAHAPEVEYVEPNQICRVCDLPNDLRYNDQWGLQLIRMPNAWSIQKGTIDTYNPKGILVAVVDTGISSTHEDVRDRLAPGGYDLYNDDPDPRDDNGHGTHVAGIVAATTNNTKGVAGVAWEGVRLLAVKAFNNNGESDVAKLAEGIRYAADQGAQVINVSAGILDHSPTLLDAVRYALSRPQKPILVAAAGNESDRSRGIIKNVIYPANYPEKRIIAVAAVGSLGSIAFYSNANSKPPDSTRGGVDIAAPGGNDPDNGSNLGELILSTSWNPDTRRDFYEYMQGTSMSAPFVSGAVALLLSEGIPADTVESVLYSTANKRGATTRNETYGWGVLDVHAALLAVAAQPQITWPRADYPVETKTTLISAIVSNAASGSIQVTIDGQPTSQPVTTQSVDARTMRIANRPMLAPGTHSLSISAASATSGRVRAAQLQFEVKPRVLQPGWYLLSLPYMLSSEGADPATVFGGKSYRMARWLPTTSEYAFHDPQTSRKDARASFNPTGANVGGSPAGLGYWVRLAEPTTLVLPGDPVLTPEYRITLAKGWTMVGSPYVFPVGLANLQYQVGTQKLPLAQAVARGWLGRNVYGFVSDSSGRTSYVPLSLSTGVIAPYQGVWVQANNAGTLIVPGGG